MITIPEPPAAPSLFGPPEVGKSAPPPPPPPVFVVPAVTCCWQDLGADPGPP
jgi:hypothetical protein